MGQSKGGGYVKKEAVTDQQQSFLNQLMQMAAPQYQQAAGGYAQFLPGGGGGKPIIDAAQQRFQQQTLPSIMEAYGSGAKGSSALNQALGAAGAGMQTDLASLLSQYQLQASQGMGNLAAGQAQLGAQTPQFAYMQRQTPFWQQATLGGLGAGGQVLGGWLGKSTYNFPKG